MREKLEKLCKWRTIFAGWQLGTRLKDDAECQAVRDHREVTILLRAEVNTISQLLIKAGVCTLDQFHKQMALEAELLDKMYEEKFPGCKSSAIGMEIDVQQVAGWMKNWRP